MGPDGGGVLHRRLDFCEAVVASMAGGQAQEGVGRASKESQRDRVEALVGVEARGGLRPAAG